MNQTLSKCATNSQLVLDLFSVNTKYGNAADLKSIIESLPELYMDQQKDVLKAERRFQTGKGILFTNGTGTGKTFVGLGIIKRFTLQYLENIIIVVPTDKKAKDWIKEGLILNLKIYQLEGINDIKKGIIVTTYSNFYQNEKLINANFDLIVYDESHYLMQNASGSFTEAFNKHKKISKLQSTFDTKYRTELSNQCSYYDSNLERNVLNDEKFQKLYNNKLKEYLNKTKVVFLSASPFAYHKSVMIGDGTLWNIYEKEELKKDVFHSYNEPDQYEKFFQENFGYRMRYNKLTTPDAEVNINLMERNFFEKYSKQGVISGRQIEVDKDYSRDFITVNSHIGKKIDEGKELFYSTEFRETFKFLSKYVDRKFNYNYTNQLLECIKAKEIGVRIQQHINLGRKVIVFHNYNNSLPSHPFKFDVHKLVRTEEEYADVYELSKDIAAFEREYPELVNLDLEDLINPRATLKRSFPDLKEFNGTVSKKKRSTFIEDFNNDYSDTDLLLVQTKAGKEGISLHDKTGKKQRVLITLGLPTAPTDAIQIEGRIYRIGLLSNAVYEYITLQTNFERFAFAEKIAKRSRTAENLAMGEKARNLELVFTEGYLNAHNDEPSTNWIFWTKLPPLKARFFR